MDTRERNAEAEARELTYSFLSHLFLEEVSEDFLARLAEEPPSLEGELGRYAAGLAGADLAAARTEAAAEFAALLLPETPGDVSAGVAVERRWRTWPSSGFSTATACTG